MPYPPDIGGAVKRIKPAIGETRKNNDDISAFIISPETD
jgi:hypothetical protein